MTKKQQKRKVPNCIFCGKPADTKEHIPAKQFFKGVPDKDLITVPSCENCNKGYQKDEDFFRQFWVSMLIGKSPKARELFDKEITRAIKRAPALAHQLFKRMQKVDLKTHSGIYLGKKTAYHVSDSDRKRTNRVVEKIIKGLFYHHIKATIPKDWVVHIEWITPKKDKDLGLADIAKELNWNVIKEDTFAYGYNSVPKTHQSIWILDFFKIPMFYVLVLDKKTASKEK